MREVADRDRIERFMRALGRESDAETRVYFTGGATAVLCGWRDSTIDVDIKIVPDRDRLLRAVPAIKEAGRVFFHHFDLYAQALAKIERGHTQDLDDVRQMLHRQLIDPAKGLEYFASVEPFLYRFPSIDHHALRAAVHETLRPSR